MTSEEELLSKVLYDLEDHKVFSYRLKHLLKCDAFWEYLGENKPKNGLRWLALPDNSGLTENFLGKVLRNDSSLALSRADLICTAMKLRLWQMTKPDYDFIAFFKEAKSHDESC